MDGLHDATVGSVLRAVVAFPPELPALVPERYFWFSLVARSTQTRPLVGAVGDCYTPTRKLRGKCIGCTVHFSDGSSATSVPTAPVKVAGTSSFAEASSVAPDVPSDASLKALSVLRYDTAAFDFQAAVHAYLGLGPATALDSLHSQVEGAELGQPSVAAEAAAAAASGTAALAKRLCAAHDQADWSREPKGGGAPLPIVTLFDAFVEAVVVPEMCRGVGEAALRRVAYQAKPSLRVQVPGAAGIRFHRDADYGHQTGEVNWWLPVTATFATNTLQLESSPGAGDFVALELGLGEVARFWGNQCRHGTVANATAATRVSLDFRVAAVRDFDHDAPIGRRPDGVQRFAVGGYYRLSRAPDAEAPTLHPGGGGGGGGEDARGNGA